MKFNFYIVLDLSFPLNTQIHKKNKKKSRSF